MSHTLTCGNVSISVDLPGVCLGSPNHEALQRTLNANPRLAPALLLLAELLTVEDDFNSDTEDEDDYGSKIDPITAHIINTQPPLDTVLMLFHLSCAHALPPLRPPRLWRHHIDRALCDMPDADVPLSTCRLLLERPHLLSTRPFAVMLAALCVLRHAANGANDAHDLREVAHNVATKLAWLLLVELKSPSLYVERVRRAFQRLPPAEVVAVLGADTLDAIDSELCIVELCQLWWCSQGESTRTAEAKQALCRCVRVPLLQCVVAKRIMPLLEWAEGLQAQVQTYLKLDAQHIGWVDEWPAALAGQDGIPEEWLRGPEMYRATGYGRAHPLDQGLGLG